MVWLNEWMRDDFPDDFPDDLSWTSSQTDSPGVLNRNKIKNKFKLETEFDWLFTGWGFCSDLPAVY